MQTIVLGPGNESAPVISLMQEVGASGAEVRDASGRVIAYVLPPEQREAFLYAEAFRQLEPHQEQIRQAMSRRGGKTTAQLLESLTQIPLPPHAQQ